MYKKISILFNLNLLAFINGLMLINLMNYNFFLFTGGICFTHSLSYYLNKYKCNKKKDLVELKNQYKLQSFDIFYILRWIFIESFTYMYLVKYSSNTNIFYSILIFIPKTFLIEIIFDFLYYLLHRYLHINKTLYKLTHKLHHHHHNNIGIITLYHTDLLEIMTSTLILSFITYFVSVDKFQLLSWVYFKILLEHGGHRAQDDHLGCFPQCFIIPELLDINLNNADHFLHHLNCKYNYSKRFTLWDKVFGTFKPYKPKNNKYKLSLPNKLFIGLGLSLLGYLY